MTNVNISRSLSNHFARIPACSGAAGFAYNNHLTVCLGAFFFSKAFRGLGTFSLPKSVQSFNLILIARIFLGEDAYGVADDVAAIQKEILANGPVEVAFEVYDDFLHYESGIYVVRNSFSKLRL